MPLHTPLQHSPVSGTIPVSARYEAISLKQHVLKVLDCCSRLRWGHVFSHQGAEERRLPPLTGQKRLLCLRGKLGDVFLLGTIIPNSGNIKKKNAAGALLLFCTEEGLRWRTIEGKGRGGGSSDHVAKGESPLNEL